MDSFQQQPAATPYGWDLDKKARFPQTMEAFVATHQGHYGFSNGGVSSSTANIQDVSARDAEKLLQRKTPNPLTPKRGEIKEEWNQDDFMLKKMEIQIYYI